jgi:hypothetical protein
MRYSRFAKHSALALCHIAQGLPLWRRLHALAADCSGGVAVTLGLSFLVTAGFAGLAVEVGDWYLTKRTMQGAADSAAYSATTAKAVGGTASAYTSEAKSVAGSYGYVDQNNGVAVTVNSPPASGNHASDNTAVEVIITRPQPLALASLFLLAPPTIEARAVASSGATGCILALDRGNVTDLTDSGNTILNLDNCNIYVNASDAKALTLSGSATINANAVFITGNYTTSGHAALNTTQGTHTGVLPADDPYADVPIPSYQGCAQNNFSLSGGLSRTFTTGTSGVMVFCNGFSVSGGSNVTLNPAIYIIDHGDFTLSGNSSLSGSGVTIVLTSSTGANYATVSISGGATVSLTAPTSGPTAGLAFFQDRNAPAAGSNRLTGGSTQNITGVIYFPNQNLTFSGGTTTAGAPCTQVLALTLTFSGNSSFNNASTNNCAGTGMRGIGNGFVQLVE